MNEGNQRRELAILTFVTLDGVMQAPAQPEEDFSGDFRHGGWGWPYWDEVMAQVRQEAMAEPYDLLLGRKTFEIFAPHFCSAEPGNAEADLLNRATKYVVTNTLSALGWQNSIAISGDVAAAVAKLKAQPGPLLQVHGSWQLIQALLANDLIDEFRLWTFPVLVGAGKRLFGDGVARGELTLAKSGATSNGVQMGIYRRAAPRP
ncbi:MAG: dihydrofolate reductase family protein [Pseudomonadota bacterium]